MNKVFQKLISLLMSLSILAVTLPVVAFAEGTADAKTVDLVLFMGQSNMAGRGDISEAPAVTEGAGYEFRAVTDPTKLYPITEPFGENENNDIINDNSGSGANRRAGGMVSALVNSYYDAAGVPIVGVQCSSGGKNTKFFVEKDSTTGEYPVLNEAVSRYTKAAEYLEANGYTIRRKFLVWCQGESDGDKLGDSTDSYKYRTNQIFTYLEENAGITNEFIVRTGHFNYNYYDEPTQEQITRDANYLRIANAQTEIAEADDAIELVASFYTDEAFSNMPDQYHYTQPIYNSVGEMAGHNIAAAFDSLVEAIPVPEIESAVATPEPTATPEPEATQDPSGSKDVDVTFDYNEAAEPAFVDIGNNSITNDHMVKADDASDKYIQLTAGKAGTSSIASSYLDLTEYTNWAQEIEISFDMHIPYQSRSRISLIDANVRGENNGGSSGSTHSDTGVIFKIIGDKNGKLEIGGTNIASYTASSTDETTLWAHYDISIDLLKKTVSYSVKSLDGLTTYTSGEGKAFIDDASTAFTGIETYSWLKGEQASFDNLHIKASVPDAVAKITGVEVVSKTKGKVINKTYSLEKNYAEDTDLLEWSVSGVDGVTIDKDTGVLSASGVEGSGTATITATVKASEKLAVGTVLTYTVEILDFAVVKDFEITSSEENIDISSLEAYGTNSFRIYKSDGSYEAVTAENNTVKNTTGSEVVVVPEYKFDFTNQENPTDPLIAGYVKVESGSYDSGKGYGFDGADSYVSENGCSPKDGRTIKVDLPDGMYDITLYRLGRDHTDVYANGMQIVQNTSSVLTQGRHSESGLMFAPGMTIEGGNANITIGNCDDKGRIASLKIAKVPEFARKSVVWVAGDSESADYYPIDKDGDDLDSNQVMMTGFGMQLGKVLSDKYDIANFGQQSATAQSWSEECLTSVNYHMQKGDTIIIDFGINDGHKGVGIDTAKEYIKGIVDMAKANEAQAILVSPVYNIDYQHKSYFTYDAQTGKNDLEDFAKELKVPFIDLNRYTQEYIEAAKTETGDASWCENNYHVADTLHLTQHSALLAADFIAAGMKKLGYETTDFAYTYKDIEGTIAEDADNKVYLRGTETGVTREYSVRAVEDMVNPYDPSDEPTPTPTPTPTVATPTPTVKPARTPDPSVTPGPVLYSEDFESYEVGKNAGWKSPYGPVEVVEDATKGKYLQKASNGSTSARSAYIEIPVTIDKNFVFEADLQTSYNANQISSFEIVENSDSIYLNHGVYSNAEYAFKLARPEGANLYVVNNEISDSNLSLEKYAQPAVVTDEIGNDWLHIKVVGDFENKTTIAYITSLDGTKEYYHGMTNMSEGMDSFKCLSVISPSSTMYTCIDDIVIREATSNDMLPEYHTVTISDYGKSFDQYVLDGESVVNVPDVSIYGEYFEGWELNGTIYSTEELANVPITGDSTITSKIADAYIEPLESVEFNEFPEGNVLTMGADGDTFADNIISLKITGEKGTSFVVTPDEKVTDYSIKWSFDGFRTLDGKPTGETGSDYCDSYGVAEVSETAQTSVNFKLKNTAANYYGKVTATVTYNGEIQTVSRGLVVLGDKSSSTILPQGGYVSDFSSYEDTMVGTKITPDTAVTFGNWTVATATDTCFASLEEESDKKFIRFTRTEKGNNEYLYNEIGTLNSQAVVEMDVRFNANADIYYTDGSAGNKEDQNKEAFRVSFDGSELTLNGTSISGVDKNIWYHIEVSVSPDERAVECNLYDDAGELLGSATAAYKGNQLTTQKYLVLKPSKSKGTTDINNVTVTDTVVDNDALLITAPNSESIPESGSKEIALSVAAKTANGFDATDKAIWSIDSSAYGVSISADANNSHNATMTVTSEASSGYVKVNCMVDGVSKSVMIKLTGTKDNVAFINAPAGVMIPTTGEESVEYSAVVRNGQAEDIAGKTILYTLESDADGVSIDAQTGVLTVKADTKPVNVTVIASSTDTNGNEISRSVDVKIYNLKFSLGTERAGYTTVNAEDLYTETVGYGITGEVTSDGTALSGNGFGFNVKLERGKVYKVTVERTGELVYEKKDSHMTGIIPTESKFVDGNSIDIALFGDDVLDIALTGEGTISTIEITQVEKTKQEKPDWWTIGDSTVAQDGSWASTLNNNNEILNYPYLTEVIDEFHNSGSAGRHHMSFYNAGWFNYILANMNPGDVVSISGMGTNNSSSTKEMFVEFNNFYIDAIIEMGGYVILGTYTPTGNYGETEGKIYDADNMVFKGRRTNYAYEKAITEVYEARKDEEQIIGFVDIGKICDDKLTSVVRQVYTDALAEGKTDAQAREEANARANAIMADYWKDFNHYYDTFSRQFLPELTAEVTKIISGIGEIESGNSVTYSNGSVTVICNDETVEKADLIRVSYDAEGKLTSVESTEVDFTEGSTVTLPITATSGDEFFVWNSIESMEPLCDKCIVK